MSKSYDSEAIGLSKAIDIAIDAFISNTPSDWDENQLNHTIKCYSTWKNEVLNAEQQFKKLTSLKYQIENVFTYFQESSGDAVEIFWQKIKEEGLEYERLNRLKKFLNSGENKRQN